MDIDKVRELTDLELTDELVKQRRHLYDLRFQLATRQLTDYTQLTQHGAPSLAS
jgi:ribosomal protein L29